MQLATQYTTSIADANEPARYRINISRYHTAVVKVSTDTVIRRFEDRKINSISAVAMADLNGPYPRVVNSLGERLKECIVENQV